MEELPGALRGAFTDRRAAERARAALPLSATIEVVADDAGLDAARDLLTVEVAGGFAIHPPWLAAPAGLYGIEIDPGHAFGSGSHLSTRLALTLIEASVEAGDRVFDVGCGTGVLAIGAALRGADVIAVDIDPAAIEATLANAARNNVAGALDMRLGSADAVTGPIDHVCINVTIDIHEAIAPSLHRSHRQLLVAGLLGREQLDRCATAHGAVIDRHIESDGWMAALLTRS